jgi:hypothetical protein
MVKLLYGSPRTMLYCIMLLFVPGKRKETSWNEMTGK